LPEEFQKLLEQMMTAAERNDPDNAQKAVNVLEWAKKEQQKNQGGVPDYIRGDFVTPGSSGESTGKALTTTSNLDRPFLASLLFIFVFSNINTEKCLAVSWNQTQIIGVESRG